MQILLFSQGFIILIFIILVLIISYIIIISYRKKLHIYGGISSNIAKISSNISKISSDISNTSSDISKTSSDLYAVSYTISGEDNGLDFSQLRSLLKDAKQYGANFIERPTSETVHLSFGTFKNDTVIKGEVKRWNYDPAFMKQKSAIKNTLGSHHQIINKSELYNTIKKLIPNGIQFLPKSYTPEEMDTILKNSTINLPNTPLIIKKDNVPQQQAVRVITSKDEYYKAKKELNIKNDAVISEYIANPLLLDGKKMHIRAYYLLSIVSGIVRCTVHKEYKIYLAEEEYKKSDWLNPKIHISGVSGKSKNRRYYWPDDIIAANYDITTIEKNVNACNDVICLAMAIANIKNYPESHSGFHLYGADILITDDFKAYFIEINNKPGFRYDTSEEGWENCIKKFSHGLFSFILDGVIFPYFGIKRPVLQAAEFIGNGELAPFAKLLTGHDKFTLIPYLNASPKELEIAKSITFIKNLSLIKLMDNCHKFDIFLIMHQNNNSNANDIIGYMTLNKDSYLMVVIIEEFQNRGIATAMIAQLLEILYCRAFTAAHLGKIYIDKNNIFMRAIAKKLLFTINKDMVYERSYKNIHAINNKQICRQLTYKIVYGNPNMTINFNIDKYMTLSNSQFVSFIYNLLSGPVNKKHSTGNKYDKEFIYQGAELKSSLNEKILRGLVFFKLWIYKTLNQTINNKYLYIFDKKIDSNLKVENNKKYVVYNINAQYSHIVIGSELIDEYYNNDKYLIEEYHSPYLLEDKFMAIRHYFVIYMSANGILKFYLFPETHILTAKNKYVESDMHHIDTSLVFCSATNKKYNISDIEDISGIGDTEDLFISFFELISQYDIKPYPESNSGFLECIVDIKFVKKGIEVWTPIIHKCFNWYGVQKNNIIDDQFVDNYYTWLKNCTILPHFGLLKHNLAINSILYKCKNSKMDINILKCLFLEIDINSVKIFYNDINIGHIKLSQLLEILTYSCIEVIHIEILPKYRKKNITMHVIFILMDILRAYYAPMVVHMAFKYVKPMHKIAFELNFQKNKDYYMIKM
jgi:hypothetical protein